VQEGTEVGQERGFSFIELLIVTTILLILAATVMPLAEVTAQRQREVELRRALREMRTAIDRFKDAADTPGRISPTQLEQENEGYPPDLETLVEGIDTGQAGVGEQKLKFLRRIPIDPMTNGMDWGLRSYQDDSDSRSWGGENVFDVYTTSDATALDGTRYRDW
jgi:general secretion pathway protein G